MTLTDRVAVVTGASSGVGAATARRLADEGCRVVLAARREHRLREVAADVETDALVAPTDVTDDEAVDAMVDAAREEFGRIDLLVNSAGLLRGDPVREADRADLRAQVDVNLAGVMNVTQAVLPALLESGGDVVTVSSMNAEHPAAGGSAYSASKAGVNAFCASLRRELSDEDVRVTVLLPGPIQSEMRDWSDWDGRALDPADVADAVAYAASRPSHVELPELTVNTTDKLSQG